MTDRQGRGWARRSAGITWSFVVFSHLGSIYGLGFMQFSMLWLETGNGDSVILNVGRRFDEHAAHYRLGFVRQDGAWKLSRIDYRDLHERIPPEVVEYYDQHGWPPGLKQEGAGDTLR